MNVIRIPIRLKILISLLLLVTAAVGVITFAMANLFHQDKEAYINDLVSMVAMSTAEECDALIAGYRERMQVYARLIVDEHLDRDEKSRLLAGLFDDFPELVAIGVEADDARTGVAYNTSILEAAGVSKERLQLDRETNPLPFESILEGQVYLRNSTLAAALPTMTLAMAPESIDTDGPIVVWAMVRLEGLLRLARRARAFEVFLAGPDGVLLAHRDLDAVGRHEPADFGPEISAVDHRFSAGLTTEYEKDGVPMLGGFARSEIGGVAVGVHIPKAAAHLASRDLLGQLLAVALILLAVATLVALFWARRITRPVEELSRATREIARGRFDVEIGVDSRDEMGELSGSFNHMASELKQREDALHQAHAQLVQSEKMAAFGQLGAGIAHEVKNPLAGILGCAQLALRKTARESPQRKHLELIEKETRRCKTIIENLLRFARQEKSVLRPIRIDSVVEDAVAIVNHQLEMHKIGIECDMAEGLPMVKGNPNQLQQVLMNLMINAQQAMDGQPGTVRVTTTMADESHVQITVSDTGPGIPPEIRHKVFEPFFTTKPGGKGTGLGLSVSFGIIEEHGGAIVPDERPQGGAEFRITLPALVFEGQQPVVRKGR